MEAIQQEAVPHKDSEADLLQETLSSRNHGEDFPPVLPNCVNHPPLECPNSPLEDCFLAAE